jgi:hypothetical protein
MVPPDKRTGGPPGPPVTDSPPPGASSAPTIARGADAAAELEAWGAAVIHLHRAGLPAAVPEFPAAWLRHRGVAADWVSAA